MKQEILDKNGKFVEEINLEEGVFGVEINEPLLTQYIHVFRTNQRQGTSSSKTRAEVSGGGKKPWRQKGTGRARHGSTRSPIWVHGGISHGPKPRNWELSFPKKMKKLAMLSALTLKKSSDSMKALDEISTKKPNSKYISELLNTLSLSGKTLFIVSKKEDSVLKSVANVKNATLSDLGNLNVYSVLEAKNVVFEKEALLNLQKSFK